MTVLNVNPWIQQYAFNESQSAALGSWTTGTPLPNARYSLYPLVTKNRVYLCGGNVDPQPPVIYADINTDGTIGAWTGDGNTVYDYDGSNFILNDVAYFLNPSSCKTSPISALGVLGVHSNVPTMVLPNPTSFFSFIATRNRIYALGGWDTYSVIPNYSEYYLNVVDSGPVSTWQTGNSLGSYPKVGASLVFVGNFVYLIGGHDSNNWGNFQANILVAPVDSNGIIGAWSFYRALPYGFAEAACVVTKNRFYIIGGRNTAGAINVILSAMINADGTLGTLEQQTFNTNNGYKCAAFATSSRLYLVGGIAYDGTLLDTVQSVAFSGGANDYSDYLVEQEVVLDINVDFQGYPPEISSTLVVGSSINVDFQEKPPKMEADVFLGSIINGNFNAYPPEIHAEFGSITDFRSYPPEINATVSNPIAINVDFQSMVPSVSSAVSNGIGINCEFKVPVPKITGTLAAGILINVDYEAPAPKVEAGLSPIASGVIDVDYRMKVPRVNGSMTAGSLVSVDYESPGVSIEASILQTIIIDVDYTSYLPRVAGETSAPDSYNPIKFDRHAQCKL